MPGPLGEPVPATWRLVEEPGGLRRAVVESAAACGLALAGGREHNRPLEAATRGVGELVARAVAEGADEIVVGCGGSASTDGGRGALEALGLFPPPPPVVCRDRLGGARLLVAFDVETRFVDAASCFGPQKGAGPVEVGLLVDRLERLAHLYAASCGMDVSVLRGGGAAGGLAGGLAAIGGQLEAGFGYVADAIGLAGLVEQASAIVTGEGSLDDGSFEGKVVGGVLDLVASAPRQVPVLCVAGRATPAALSEATGRGADVVVLTERYGAAASMTETAELVTDVVADWLARLPPVES